MGAQNNSIHYQNGAKYIGQVEKNSNSNPNGYGKIIFSQNCIFEGEFILGKAKKGILKINQNTVYKGETRDGKLTGDGQLKMNIQNNNEIVYEGSFINGKFLKGKITKKNDYEAQSSFSNNKYLEGVGYFSNLLKNIKYQGNFKQSKIEGNGKVTINNQDIYFGNFHKGKPQQECSFQSKAITLQGTFKQGSIQGKCKIKYKNGDLFQGTVKNNMLDGQGIYKFSNNTIYNGSFYKNRMLGICKILYPQIQKIQKYEGQVQDGFYNGFGTIYYRNGVIYSGYFNNGNKNGPGILVYCKKKLQCLFIMDRLVGTPKTID